MPTEADLGIDVDGDGTIEDAPISVDARGLERSFDLLGLGGSGESALDLGAVELQLTEGTSLEVTTTDDIANPFDGEISLREAIAAVNAGVLSGTITFDGTLDGETINLALGTLVITGDVAIDGDIDDDGSADITVSGDADGNDATTTDPFGNTITDVFNNADTADNVRVLDILGGATATLESLVITGGVADRGAGIRLQVNSTATIEDTVIAGNAATGFGGGAFIDGTATINDTTIFENRGDSARRRRVRVRFRRRDADQRDGVRQRGPQRWRHRERGTAVADQCHPCG